jgi:GTPase Era involved in 16S rRNA processing
MVKTAFTARAVQNAGRQGLGVEFRHPMRLHRGRPGRKVRKGLNTSDPKDAQNLVDELNRLLGDETFHSITAKHKAAQLFSPKVIEIFYEGLEPSERNPRAVREAILPLPSATDGFSRTLLIGIPGAGKTTLLRQLIGSDPEKDRFPSTSINRTTTSDMEIIVRTGGYVAVATFISQHEAYVEVAESVSNALIKAAEGADDEKIARDLLDQTDMRFRLKYILGDSQIVVDEADEYESVVGHVQPEGKEAGILDVPTAEQSANAGAINGLVERIKAVAGSARLEVQNALGDLFGKDPAFDFEEIQSAAEESDDFHAVVSEIVELIRERIEFVEKHGAGSFNKSVTGWPETWTIRTSERSKLLEAARFFTGIAKNSWGRLLTPLVTGLRVQGPFFPVWAPNQEDYRHVFIDTEGLGHRANAKLDLPEHIVERFREVDCILLVESAENALTSSMTGKVFETVASTGYVPKFAIAFTHFESVRGPNLQGTVAKQNHLFHGGVRNVIDNQVQKSQNREVAKQLTVHLEKNTFYLGLLNQHAPQPAIKALRLLVERMRERVMPPSKMRCFPVYSIDCLALAIREGVLEFRDPWSAMLGFTRMEGFEAAPWQSIKALTRRYSEGFVADMFWLRPISNLRSALGEALARFVDNPSDWEGSEVNETNKAAVSNRIKQKVTDGLTELVKTRLWRNPLSMWQEANEFKGRGTTWERKQKVDSIYQRYVPIPEAIADKATKDFLAELRMLVVDAIDSTKRETMDEPGAPAPAK